MGNTLKMVVHVKGVLFLESRPNSAEASYAASAQLGLLQRTYFVLFWSKGSVTPGSFYTLFSFFQSVKNLDHGISEVGYMNSRKLYEVLEIRQRLTSHIRVFNVWKMYRT